MQLTLAIHRRTAHRPATVQVRMFGSDRRPDVDAAYRALYAELVRAFSFASEPGEEEGPYQAIHRPCHARIVFRFRRGDAKRPWGFRAEADSEATVAESNTLNDIAAALESKAPFLNLQQTSTK